MRAVVFAAFVVGAACMAAATPADKLAKAWTASLGTAVSAPVLTPDESAVVLAGADGLVYAFDAATGAAAWSAPTKLPSASTCEIAFATARGLGFVVLANGEIALIDFKTGLLINATFGNLGVQQVQGCRPVYSDDADLLYVSVDDTIYAVSGTTGAVAWTGSGNSKPTFVQGIGVDCAACTVWVGATTGYMNVFNATTGDAIGQFSGNDNTYGQPAVVSGSALFTSSVAFSLVSFASFDNPTRTFNPELPAPNSSPVVGGEFQDVAFFGTSDGRMVALKPWAKKHLWFANLTGDRNPAGNSPTLAFGNVYIADVYGTVYAFDAADGALVATANISGAVRPQSVMPVSAKYGMIFAATTDGTIAAFALAGTTPPPRTPAPAESTEIVVNRCGSPDCSSGCQQRLAVPGECEPLDQASSTKRVCSGNATTGVYLTVFTYKGPSCGGPVMTGEPYELNKCYALPLGGSFEVVRCPTSSANKDDARASRHQHRH